LLHHLDSLPLHQEVLPHHLVLLFLLLDQLQLLSPIHHLELQLLQDQEVRPELEPTPRLKLHFAVTESRKLTNNAKEENAARTDADSTRPTDLAASDQQDHHLLVSRRDDATDSEFADQPSSNKTPRRSAPHPLAFEDSATSSLESANNFLVILIRSGFI